MNARLIAAMASRREKSRTLPIQNVRITPDGGEAGLIDESASTVRSVDRLIVWICAFGLVGVLAWRAAELAGVV